MKKILKNWKMKIKSNLLVKLAKVRKENRYLKEKLAEEVIEKRKIIDEITKKQEEIRRLSLEVKMRRYFATNKELTLLLNDMTKSRVKCSCGHSVLIPTRKDKTICSWCGNYVFRNKQDEFKYRFKENLLKEKRLGK